MSSYLPKEVREGLDQARERAARKAKSRLRVHVGPEAYSIRRFGGDDFTLKAQGAPRLRGLVDIFDGSRHLYQALIVTASQEGSEMRYEFKRMTKARDQAPLDYDRDRNAPVALIAKD